MNISWIFIAMIPPFLWALNNHIDKFLVTRFSEKYGSEGLVVISAIFGVVFLPLLLIFVKGIFVLPIINNILLLLSGFAYVLALIFYIKAFSFEETSRLVVVFGILPVFSYVFGYLFLGEVLSLQSLFGGLIVIIGVALISFKFDHRKTFVWKPLPVLLMVLASIFFALSFALYKTFAIGIDFWPTLFWQYSGIALAGLFLMFFSKFRTSFFSMVRYGSRKILILNACNEILNFLGITLTNFVYLIAPIALVAVSIQAFQTLFSIIIGVILTLFFSHIGKEDISAQNVVLKIMALLIVVLGLVIAL